MIKFAGHRREDKKPVLGIGLSRDECNRLATGQPIIFQSGALGLPDIEVFIIGGETEEAIAAEMFIAGAAPVEIKGDPIKGPVS